MLSALGILANCLKFACETSNLSLPEKGSPKVRFASQERIAKIMGSYSYEAIAVYNPDIGIILSEFWDEHDPFDQSVFIHELVHWLQDKHKLYDCTQLMEPLAYHVQNEYLKPFGLELNSDVIREVCLLEEKERDEYVRLRESEPDCS